MNYYHLHMPYLGDGSRKGKRKTFALIKGWKDGLDKRRSSAVDEPRVDVVNSRYLAGEISYREAQEQLTIILLEYRSKEVRQSILTFHHLDNAKVYESIWSEDYKHRFIASASSRMMEFAKLLELLGHESIIATSPLRLQKIIDEHCGPNHNRQRRMAGVANQLLRFIYSRGMTKPAGLVKLKKKRRKEVSHLTLTEFTKVLKHVPNLHLKALYVSAMSTGARLGELMRVTPAAIEPGKSGTGMLLVQGQIVRAEAPHQGDSAPSSVKAVVVARDLLKNQTERRSALVLEFGMEGLRLWASVPILMRLSLRKRAYLSELKKAVALEFPGRKLKFHDLRHSYAIHLLALGMSLEDVSRSIGDTMEVCEEFYAGFSHTPLSMLTMADRYLTKLGEAQDDSRN